MRKVLIGLAASAGLTAALFVGSGAVTSAESGIQRTQVFDHGDSKDIVTATNDLTYLGGENLQLAATGTTTKFHVVGGVGVWNMKMWWDDLGAGASYKTTQVSLWNPGNAYNQIQWTIRYGDGVPNTTGVANAGQTIVEGADHTSGGPTTKSDSDQAITTGGSVVDPSGCVYLTPTGGSDSGTDCAV